MQQPHFAQSRLIVRSIIEQLIIKVYGKIKDNQLVRNKMNQFTSMGLFSLVTEINDQLVASPSKRKQVVKASKNAKQYQEISQFYEDIEAVTIVPDNMMSLQHLQVQEKEEQIMADPGILQKQDSKHVKKLKSSKISSIAPQPQSNRSISKSQISKNFPPQFHKLPSDAQQIDKVLDEMRKQAIYNQNNSDNKDQTPAKKQKTVSDAINYDYEGGLFQMKQDKKSSLVRNNIEVKTTEEDKGKNKKKNLSRAASQHNESGNKLANPQKISTKKVDIEEEDPSTKKKKSISKMTQKRIQKTRNAYENVQFSQITNLYEQIEVKEGVKAVFNKNVVEKKEKNLSINDLRKTIGNRKLSKNQYERIKTGQGHREKLIPPQENTAHKKQKEFKESKVVESHKMVKALDGAHYEKPYSASKIRRNTTESNNQKIHFEQDSMRQLISVEQPYLVKQTPKKDTLSLSRQEQKPPKKQQLNRIDKYNLEYTKNKGQFPITNSNQLKKSNSKNQEKFIQFPKISQHRTDSVQGSGSKSIMYPKNRERMKDGAVLIREMKKKFEENLRI